MNERVVGGEASVRLLRTAVEQVAHFLPEQAPIHAFVHHNTLHAFEDSSFLDGVERAAELFGASPYPSEDLFRGLLEKGAIDEEDLRAVVEEHLSPERRAERWGDLKYEDFVVARLKTLPPAIDENAVRFLLSEDRLFRDDYGSGLFVSGAFEPISPRNGAPALGEVSRTAISRGQREELWNSLYAARSALVMDPPSPPAIRRTELLRHRYGVDADAYVHPLLIRLAAAYLDQGVAYWTMPGREHGFYRAFVALYRQSLGALDPFLDGLKDVLEVQFRDEFSAEEACVLALRKLQVPKAQWEQYVRETLLALPGWAGMFRRFEVEPDKAPTERLPARLVDFLAVALTLEVQALSSSMRDQDPQLSRVDWAALEGTEKSRERPDYSQVHESYVMAQILKLPVEMFRKRSHCEKWLRWNNELGAKLRGRLLQLAFERHHLHEVTSAMLGHQRWLQERQTPQVAFQAVFCIDDREESYRRHLEEVDPGVQTYSFPGFFGVAMRYYSAFDIRPRDLCPAVVRPTHVVREIALEDVAEAGLGSGYGLHVGSTTMVRGYLLSVMGLLSVIPLVLAVLFPRWFHFKKKSAEPKTRLHVERDSGQHDHFSEEDSLFEGYTDEEMAQLVESMLTQMGLKSGFSPLVLVIGHGSSSVNNPHLAAYGCGATAGGCGGPNARVIAQMANRPKVRALLSERGIEIPDQTRFVPGMHDTCSDDVSLYDHDDLGEAAEEALLRAQAALEQASRNNAHERCRLFGQVPLDLSPRQAKAIVERRAVDLSEARPEYNHAKNSCCVVGRRELTRGLFLDQRAFLTSYDPEGDESGAILTQVLLGSLPVGMGINLEYFFGTVDNQVYGAGSKLPHNVSGLLGVMDGHASDLRTGLYRQMIELHEPTRLIAIVESTPEVLLRILAEQPRLKGLADGGWIHLLCFEPKVPSFSRYQDGCFVLLPEQEGKQSSVASSLDVYREERERLPFLPVRASFREGAA